MEAILKILMLLDDRYCSQHRRPYWPQYLCTSLSYLQIALEAIEEINLKFEHLDTDRFVFPATIGNYRGKVSCVLI